VIPPGVNPEDYELLDLRALGIREMVENSPELQNYSYEVVDARNMNEQQIA